MSHRTGVLLLLSSASLLIARPAQAQYAEAAGQAMPAFSVPTAAGDSLRLRDFHGRLLVVDLWTSWCIPCKVELPALDSLAGTLDTTLVAVIALTDDVSRAAADDFLRAHPVHHLRIGYGGGQLKPVLHYFGVPETWVVDTSGRVLQLVPGFAGASQIQAIRNLLATAAGRAPERSH